MTQCEMLLEDLKAGQGVTPHDALRDYGCFRLAARVQTLRSEGYNIVTEKVSQVNRFGKKITYGRYWLSQFAPGQIQRDFVTASGLTITQKDFFES